MKNLLNVWKKELSDKNFKLTAIIAPILIVFTMIIFTRFLNFIELRPGVVLPDPLLALFNPIDISWFTFLIMYGALIAGILSLISHPKHLVLALISYMIMIYFRIPAMWSIPLEAPATILPLIDPMVSEVGVGRLMTKDLFFSGHTATIMLIYLCSPTKKWRIIFLTLTIIVALAVLVQHVHYTVDVIAAPFFAYISYYLGIKISNKLYNN
ncbi:MAG TPA: phosphatase PAP2-related protein [Candidatus Kapabacteria bacterium]|nr:phosphatase PAP2-related protein [Candidatus Kapabacteria bacterium]